MQDLHKSWPWLYLCDFIFTPWHCVQVYEPIDYLHLYGEDPIFPQGGGAKMYVATGDSGQGAALTNQSLPSFAKHMTGKVLIAQGPEN